MGNPASVLVTCSAIAVLVVFALHALILRTRSHRRPGRLVRLLGAVTEKVILAVYVLIGVSALLAFVPWCFSDHTPTVPPQEACPRDEAFATLLRYGQPSSRSRGSPAEVLAGVREDAQELERVSRDGSMPPVYLLQLCTDAWLVERYQRSEPGSLPDTLVQSAAQDLRAKAQYANKNPRNPFGRVLVKATTQDQNGNPVNDREIRYCLKGVQRYPSRHSSFDRWSSPTSDKLLLPGAYLIWARRPDYMLWGGGAFGVQKEVEVGVNGESEVSVNIPVE